MNAINWKQQPLINRDKAAKKRFELGKGPEVPYLEYILNNQNTIFLTHTEVPVSLEGNGVGSLLVGKVLDHVKKSGMLMAPLCPFVAAYLKKHPEKAEGILAPGYSIGT